jgi:predicted ribosome quality control (RQC) complex YloA/Tae2 family protein
MKTYESLDGITIRVGTNAKENYELVESSHAANWWLHVKGWPGSHVVVSRDLID